MLKNYLKTAFRNLARNKANTAINVLGLTLGITCSLVLFLVIRFELSFNKHFADGDRMYKVVTEFLGEDGNSLSSSMQFPFVKTFATAYPDVPITFIHRNLPARSFYVTEDGERKRFQEAGNIGLVHADYPKVFEHEWLGGNPETALTEINSIVLTRKMAMKFFGQLDVVGKTLGYVNAKRSLKVTGVIEDYPKTTDFPLDLLISIETNDQYRNNLDEDGWGGNYSAVNAFIKLPKGMTQAGMEGNLEGFDEKYSGEEDLVGRQLQPLSDMHYNEALGNPAGRTISKASLWSIGVIGALLLVAACINFVNLNTALAVRRSKEVGIRKVLGSTRGQLLYQFLGETFLITFLALLISFGATELALMQLQEHLGYDLDFNLFQDGQTILFLGGAFLFSVLFSGLYPAVILASYKPVIALKNKITAEKQGRFSLRKMLVATQLMISQALIICTVIIVKQMDYFYNAPIGLDKESVIEFRVPGGQATNQKLFKERALQIPGVDKVTLTNSGAISNSVWVGPYILTMDGEKIRKDGTQVKFIDPDFLDTYGIKLVAGRLPSENDSISDFLVNEKLISELNLEDPNDIIGMPMEFWGNTGFVVGIVADYNTQSLHNSLSRVVMLPGQGFSWTAVRFKTADTKAMLASLETVYAEVFPNKDFEPKFLDELIANFYEEEQKASTLFQIAAGVAIFIGCIGMLGLISYVASRKVKEVGIRKVLGASVSNILLLFSRQFVGLTLIGFVLAAPLTYYIMDQWLRDYEYRVSLGVGTFALGLGGTLVLVMLSIGFRAYHSATINPAKSLRSE